MKLPRGQTTSLRLGPHWAIQSTFQDKATTIAHTWNPKCSPQKGTPKAFSRIPNDSEIKVHSQFINLSANHPAQGPAEAHNVFLSTALTHPSGRIKQIQRSYKTPERQGVGELKKPRVYSTALNAPIWLPRASPCLARSLPLFPVTPTLKVKAPC